MMPLNKDDIRTAIKSNGYSMTSLSRSMGLSDNAILRLLSGEVNRNIADKTAIAIRLACELNLDGVAVLSALELDMKDTGTPELLSKRAALSMGGDYRLCSSALGILAAHGESQDLPGISKTMLSAGLRLQALHHNAFFDLLDGKHMVKSCLKTESYGPAISSEAGFDHDYIKEWREAVSCLGARSRLVKSVAIDNKLPSYAGKTSLSKAEADSHNQLRKGLSTLFKHFASVHQQRESQ